MKHKILLDTDLGSDIDDAVCLAYLLCQPDCELLGITTVSGEPVKRAQIGYAICQAANRTDIPIYPGAPNPLIIPPRQVLAPHASALKIKEFPDFPAGEYLNFMRRTIREHPGEITLLAIGPMTNVALLFAMDPELPSLLKSLVLMCGRFYDRPLPAPVAEWNALLDPHAAAMVYSAKPPLHISYGLDVTMQVTMPSEEVRERFSGPILETVLSFAEVWFSHTGHITFHDPLAAVGIFEPDICEYDNGLVEIELKSDKLGGTTLFDTKSEPHHQVARSVDAARFFDHYFGLTTGR